MRRNKLIQLTDSEAFVLRKKQWKKQGKKCAVLKKKINWIDAVLDHKHKKQNEKNGVDGKGLVRGVLHMQVNSYEGEITRRYFKYGLHNLIDLPSLLRNLADYLENPPVEQKYIHPNEKEHPKPIGKREYNKLIKLFKAKYPKRKIPVFPKRKTGKPKKYRITKPLENLTKEFKNEL